MRNPDEVAEREGATKKKAGKKGWENFSKQEIETGSRRGLHSEPSVTWLPNRKWKNRPVGKKRLGGVAPKRKKKKGGDSSGKETSKGTGGALILINPIQGQEILRRSARVRRNGLGGGLIG